MSQIGLVVTYLETPLHKSIRYLRREVLWDNDVVLKVALGYISSKGVADFCCSTNPSLLHKANKGLSVLYM